MTFRIFLNIALVVLLLFIGVRAYITGNGPDLTKFTGPLNGEVVILKPKTPKPLTAPAEASADATPVTVTKAPPEEVKAEEAKAPEPEHFSTAMHYAVTLSGFPVADIFLGLRSLKDGQTEVRSIIKSTGIADIAGGYKSETTTVARFTDKYTPVSYTTQFKLKGGWRTIKLAYGADGSVTQPEYNDPPEKRWKRAEVPAENKNGAFDPLTAALAAREALKSLAGQGKHKAGDKFTIPLYDGRRRADLVFTVLGKTKHGNISLSFAEIPIAGYTNNEIEGFAENQHVVHLEVDPDTFMPVRASGNSVLGMAEGTLQKQCSTPEECMR